MADTIPFRRIAVIGTGLIGGSFALAVRKFFPHIQISGWDRNPHAAEVARARGALHSVSSDMAAAVRDADLIYVALPVSAILRSLAPIAAAASKTALVTDAGSTKKSAFQTER